MVENIFRWFGYVERKYVDYIVRRIYHVEIIQTYRDRGWPRKVIREIITKDLEINKLDTNIVLNKTLW